MISSLAELTETCQSRITALFDFYLEKKTSQAPLLQKAMYYSVSNGGKYLRPLLVYATGLIFDAPLENLDIPASAVELIHSYSLIHDDLPAMDNADLRRGKAACHKAFSEAIAILAGDALQPLAYEIIARHPAQLTTEQRLKMIYELAHASGLEGMAAGQALDIIGLSSLSSVENMYALKTGALFTASIKLGMIAANSKEHAVLNEFASYIGLAFQIQDDLLDFSNDPTLIGKPIGLDAINKKTTYPSLVGIEKAREKIHDLLTKGTKVLILLGEKASLLHSLTQFILEPKEMKCT